MSDESILAEVLIQSQLNEVVIGIDACAAALGAWHWKDDTVRSKWLMPANPPLHPYDYCC